MPRQPPDLDRLIAEVAARHGVLLKRDDAAFALVTLNQLMLEQVMAELDDTIGHAVSCLDSAAARIQARAGQVIAQEVRETLAALRSELSASRTNRRQGAGGPVTGCAGSASRRAALVAGGVVLFALGLSIGMLLR